MLYKTSYIRASSDFAQHVPEDANKVATIPALSIKQSEDLSNAVQYELHTNKQ